MNTRTEKVVEEFDVVAGMVFPTSDAKVVAASEEEIAAANRLIDEAEAAGIEDF